MSVTRGWETVQSFGEILVSTKPHLLQSLRFWSAAVFAVTSAQSLQFAAEIMELGLGSDGSGDAVRKRLVSLCSRGLNSVNSSLSVCFQGPGLTALLQTLGVNELLYFRILRPPDIGYIFSAAPARDFGGDFVSTARKRALGHPVSVCLSENTGGADKYVTHFTNTDTTSSYDEIFLVPAEPADGCSELRNTHLMEGQVILLQRGGCSFVRKARNVEEAGGRAVLIADDAWDNDSQYLDMITDGTTDTPSIPALFLLGRDGYELRPSKTAHTPLVSLMMIRRSLQRQSLPWAVISIPVNVSALASFPLQQPPWTLW
ncbi:hypothetical protein JZ751_006564 [Albula glossodonta]|uniref:PA domain-containing protein n=1 Tax=Albula glossodonta TaxID=121402 RepID=A0A8T2NE26_9TELE|nr:hypothetical protein JZ751_006564 [Albula glossodonta]